MADTTWAPIASAVPGAAGGSPCQDSPAGRFLCDPGAATRSWIEHTVSWLAVYWPALVAVAALAAVAVAVLLMLRAQSRWSGAARAVWLEITPPPYLPPDGALAGWQAIAGTLRRTRRRSLVAPVLAAEFCADYSGVRAGLWVPPPINADRLADAIGRAWPGSRVRPGIGPDWHDLPACAVELRPRGSVWAPLIDPSPTLRAQKPATEIGEERLRAVLGALARRGPGEQACVQLIVTTRRHRGGRSPVSRGAAGLAQGAARAMVELVELLLPGRHRTPRTTHATAARPADPAVAAAVKAADTKRAAGPHLAATLRVAVGAAGVRGPARHRVVRRRLVADVAAGYDLVATLTPLRGRWRWWAAGRLATRTPGRAFVATLGELAAMWHLPAEPSRYGLAGVAARTRPPGGRLPRIHPPARHPDSAHRDSGHAPG